MNKPLPAGWCRVRLGEVLEQVNRFEQVKPGCEYRLLGVKWYANGCHLHTEILGHALKTKILSTVRAGDITYNKMWTSKGAFGVVQPEQDGFVATSEYPLFTSHDSALSPAFLSYIFRQRKFWVAARALCKGTTQRARLNPSDFLRLEIDLPPRSEQERIIAVLRAVDEAIEANEEVITRACDFKKALAHELLTRGLPGRHTRFKDSPIGRIPEEWEVRSLGECGVWSSGGTPSKANPAFWQGDIPWVSAKDMKASRIVDTQDHVTAEGAKEGTRVVPVKTLLMVVRGMILAHTFPVAITERPMAFNQDLKALECLEEILPEFLLHALQHHGQTILQYSTVATHGTLRIPQEDLKEILIRFPSPEEQKSIVNAISAIDEQVDSMFLTTRRLQTLRSVLTVALLSGRED